MLIRTADIPKLKALIVPAKTTAQTGATLTLTLDSQNRYYRCTVACVVTVPVIAAMEIDAEIHFRQVGAGALTITAGSGVTINGISGFSNGTDLLGSTLTLKKVGAAEYDLIGLVG